MELRKCKECVNHLQSSCPFFVNVINEDLLDKITENGRREFNFDCFQTEEDKWLCDMMCGDVEND